MRRLNKPYTNANIVSEEYDADKYRRKDPRYGRVDPQAEIRMTPKYSSEYVQINEMFDDEIYNELEKDEEPDNNIPMACGYHPINVDHSNIPSHPVQYLIDNDRSHLTLLSNDRNKKLYARLCMNTYSNGSPNGSRWLVYEIENGVRKDILPGHNWNKATIIQFIKQNMCNNYSKAIDQL